jgi:hypothetical protein
MAPFRDNFHDAAMLLGSARGGTDGGRQRLIWRSSPPAVPSASDEQHEPALA